MIYFIQDTATLAIKIGLASDGDGEARRRKLQNTNPSALVLLASKDGSADEGRRLRSRLVHARVHGDWFRPVPELLLHILSGQPIPTDREDSEEPRETSEEQTKRLLAWVVSCGGKVTARGLQRNSVRRYRSSTVAATALDELARAGHGHWERVKHTMGGRPTRVFVLNALDHDATPISPSTDRTPLPPPEPLSPLPERDA